MTTIALPRPDRRPSTGLVRVGRAVVLGGLSLLLATGAHLLGGGVLPGAGVLLVAAVVLGLLAVLVTSRRCRFGLLLVVLTGQQLALHVLFDLANAARACTLDSMAGHATQPAHLASTAYAASTCPPDGTMTMSTGGVGTAMVVAHVVAVVVTAWLLGRGEAWLWRAVDRVVAAALGTRPRGATRRRTLPVAPRCARRWTSRVWLATAPRGPPPVPVP